MKMRFIACFFLYFATTNSVLLVTSRSSSSYPVDESRIRIGSTPSETRKISHLVPQAMEQLDLESWMAYHPELQGNELLKQALRDEVEEWLAFDQSSDSNQDSQYE